MAFRSDRERRGFFYRMLHAQTPPQRASGRFGVRVGMQMQRGAAAHIRLSRRYPTTSGVLHGLAGTAGILGTIGSLGARRRGLAAAFAGLGAASIAGTHVADKQLSGKQHHRYTTGYGVGVIAPYTLAMASVRRRTTQRLARHILRGSGVPGV